MEKSVCICCSAAERLAILWQSVARQKIVKIANAEASACLRHLRLETGAIEICRSYWGLGSLCRQGNIPALARRLERARRWNRVLLGLKLRRFLERTYLTTKRIWPRFNSQPSYPKLRQFRIAGSPLSSPWQDRSMSREWKDASGNLFAVKPSAKSNVKGGFAVDLTLLCGASKVDSCKTALD